MQNAYGLKTEDAVLQKTPFSFDVSVWEFFWPLLVGARLVMARPGWHKDPMYLSETIERNRITTLHFVPSMLQAFLELGDSRRCSSVKRIICSGEALSADVAWRCREVLPLADLHNLYGPTEATVDVTSWTYPARGEKATTIPIGRPIANTRVYILDKNMHPVPVGVVGVSVLRRILAIRHATENALFNYSLVRLSMPMWLFEARETVPPSGPAWRRLLGDDIQVVPVQGTHHTLTTGLENLRCLGAAITGALAKNRVQVVSFSALDSLTTSVAEV
jgi:hypothetical protein